MVVALVSFSSVEVSVVTTVLGVVVMVVEGEVTVAEAVPVV